MGTALVTRAVLFFGEAANAVADTIFAEVLLEITVAFAAVLAREKLGEWL
jgi:hypothetical protein